MKLRRHVCFTPQDESNSEGLNAMRKTGRGRRKVAREPNAPEGTGSIMCHGGISLSLSPSPVPG